MSGLVILRIHYALYSASQLVTLIYNYIPIVPAYHAKGIPFYNYLLDYSSETDFSY